MGRRDAPSANMVPLLAVLLAIGVATVIAVVSTPPTVAVHNQRAKDQSGSQGRSTGAPAFPIDGQGVYESCSPTASSCVEHLQDLATSGFQLVLNYAQFDGNATLGDQVAYAAHASALGMRVIWPLQRWLYHSNGDGTLAATYPALSQSLTDSGMCAGYDGTNYAFASCFVRAVLGLAGTWGYYIGDELPASSEPDLRHLVDAIYDVDPSHPRLYVASGINGLNQGDLAAFGRQYCDGSPCHADATVLAQDVYPIGAPIGGLPAGDPAALTDQIAGGVQAIAKQVGDGYGMVLQAHSLAEYPELYGWCTSAQVCPYPTLAQMLGMRDAVLAHPTPQLILWYSDFDLQRSADYARHWSDLVAAVNLGRAAQSGQLTSAAPLTEQEVMAALLQAILFAVLLVALCLVVRRRALR